MGVGLRYSPGSPQKPTGTSRTMGWLGLFALLVSLSGILCQDDEESKSHEAKLCEDKSSGELFRLKGGEDSCRDVIQCTAAGLQAIRCPPGLAFDLEKQTCDWKWAVKNCDKLTKEKKVKPLLSTDEPLCENNKLAQMGRMRMHAISTMIPTAPLHATKRSASCPTASALRTGLRCQEISVQTMITASGFHRWSQ